MSCRKIAEKNFLLLLKRLIDVFSIADCITLQTAAVLGEVPKNKARRYLILLAKVGYIDIHKIGKGVSAINLYCLSGREPNRIYVRDGEKGVIIKFSDVAKAVEKIVSGFISPTGSIRIKRVKDMLGLPNTALVGAILIHFIMSLIKDAVIRKEVRDSRWAHTTVLVVDRNKALKLITERKRGPPLS